MIVTAFKTMTNFGLTNFFKFRVCHYFGPNSYSPDWLLWAIEIRRSYRCAITALFIAGDLRLSVRICDNNTDRESSDCFWKKTIHRGHVVTDRSRCISAGR